MVRLLNIRLLKVIVYYYLANAISSSRVIYYRTPIIVLAPILDISYL